METRAVGDRCWFEYHCNESHDSPDAPVWYRSHQQATIIGIDNAEHVPKTQAEREDAAMPLVYMVRFDDGLEWGVFEDELLDATEEFQRPSPPAAVAA